MRRTVVLAVMSLAVLLVVGWRWWSVPLATGPAPDPNYCRYLSSEEGELVEGLLGLEVKTRDRTHTMTWPVGFTARRSAEGIEVLSASGTVVAATGHTYRFHGPSWPEWTGEPGCVEEISASSG